jgi:hypothetical protein
MTKRRPATDKDARELPDNMLLAALCLAYFDAHYEDLEAEKAEMVLKKECLRRMAGRKVAEPRDKTGLPS